MELKQEQVKELSHSKNYRETIMKAQELIAAQDQVECMPIHFFADGVYGREMVIIPNVIVIGKIHKHAHLNIISQGRILVSTEYDGFQELEAPLTFISKPGTKRMVFALEETIWTTLHANPTNTQDLKELEEMIIAKDYETYEAFEAQKLECIK